LAPASYWVDLNGAKLGRIFSPGGGALSEKPWISRGHPSPISIRYFLRLSVICCLLIRPVREQCVGPEGEQMQHRLAMMTFGVLREPYGSPFVQGLVDAAASVYGAAEKAPGNDVRPVGASNTFTTTTGRRLAPSRSG
jgi:hypothetical protein